MPKKPIIPDHMLMTTVILPRDDHQRGRHAAIRRGWSFTELMRVALREWLDLHDQEKKTKPRPLAQIARELRKRGVK